MSDDRTALVIGATGGIGGEVARRLLAGRWRVRALHRRPEAAMAAEPRLHWMRGDAMNPAEVAAAARGAALIVHAANPPGYRNWQGLALPMLENTVAAATAERARILFPGTVYNFGPDAFPCLTETAPQRPLTRKGAIRVAMEQRLAQAAEGGARVLVVRAGDYFGPRQGNGWFAQCLVRPGAPLRRVVYPGRPEAGHAWAYLPDVAETMVRLLDRADALASFEVFHFAGHALRRGIAMAEAIRCVAGRPDLPIRGLPWPVLYLAAPFVTTLREMLEMRYLWRESVFLDNAKLVGLLGAEPQTPLDEAVRATLQGLGCLPEEAAERHAPVAV